MGGIGGRPNGSISRIASLSAAMLLGILYYLSYQRGNNFKLKLKVVSLMLLSVGGIGGRPNVYVSRIDSLSATMLL